MPNNETHFDEEPQHSEALQGIGGWSEAQSMSSDKGPDNNIGESAVRGGNKNSKKIKKQQLTK